MSNNPTSPQRAFATELVKELQNAGYQALFAGGCVRDEYLGRTPKDYDVATNATPEQVLQVFQHRRTFPVGAAFGVILIRGPKTAGDVEVATFRRDLGYSDGRRPDKVEFSTAEEDAQRRDFTINGLFYDIDAQSTEDAIIDYVGGQQDLDDGVVRAIGDPVQRFDEDKLRMLRAVRFTATLGFRLHEATLATIQQRPADIQLVSGERINMELRRMLTHPTRDQALRLMHESKLLGEIIPVVKRCFREPSVLEGTANVLNRLADEGNLSSFALAMAAVLRPAIQNEDSEVDPTSGAKHIDRIVQSIADRLKLSNQDSRCIRFVLQKVAMVHSANEVPWSQLQRVLIEELAPHLVAFASSTAEESQMASVEFCRQKLQLSSDELNPAPLLDGNDLKSRQVPGGKLYKRLLTAVRDAQLLKEITSKEEAWQVVDRILDSNSDN